MKVIIGLLSVVLSLSHFLPLFLFLWIFWSVAWLFFFSFTPVPHVSLHFSCHLSGFNDVALFRTLRQGWCTKTVSRRLCHFCGLGFYVQTGSSEIASRTNSFELCYPLRDKLPALEPIRAGGVPPPVHQRRFRCEDRGRCYCRSSGEVINSTSVLRWDGKLWRVLGLTRLWQTGVWKKCKGVLAWRVTFSFETIEFVDL